MNKIANTFRIGQAAQLLGVNPDTLRYYERIGLLPRAGRSNGMRFYTDKDLARVRFVQRAQKMNFTLAEIAALLKLREAPQKARKSVRALTARKLAEIEAYLAELKTLRDELRLLLNLCAQSTQGCPIIEDLESAPACPRPFAQDRGRRMPRHPRGGGGSSARDSKKPASPTAAHTDTLDPR